MKIKTLYRRAIQPQADSATGLLFLISDTAVDGPVVLKFDSPQEVANTADTLANMVKQGHDIFTGGVLLQGRDKNLDHVKLHAEFLGPEPKPMVREPQQNAPRPPPPKAIPMGGRPPIDVKNKSRNKRK